MNHSPKHSLRTLLCGAAVVIASAGCGRQAEEPKPIPPTPTADQFQGATTETPLENSPSTANPR